MPIVEAEGARPQVGRVHPRLLVPMLIAARTTVLEHREVAALLATYAGFLLGVLGAALLLA